MTIDDQRTSERFSLEAPVNIQNCRSGEYHDGSIYNYSRGGMYIELDYPLAVGSQIHIVMEKPGDLPRGETCRARVIWCEEIPGAVVLYNYGIGVQYDLTVKSSRLTEKFHVIDGGANGSNCL